MKQLLQNMKTGETSVGDVPMPTPKPGMALSLEGNIPIKVLHPDLKLKNPATFRPDSPIPIISIDLSDRYGRVTHDLCLATSFL